MNGFQVHVTIGGEDVLAGPNWKIAASTPHLPSLVGNPAVVA